MIEMIEEYPDKHIESKWKEEEDPCPSPRHGSTHSNISSHSHATNNSHSIITKHKSIIDGDDEDSKRRLSLKSTTNSTLPDTNTPQTQLKNFLKKKTLPSSCSTRNSNSNSNSGSTTSNNNNSSIRTEQSPETEGNSLYTENSIDVSALYLINYADPVLFSLTDTVKLMRNTAITSGILGFVSALVSLTLCFALGMRSIWIWDAIYAVSFLISLYGGIKVRKQYLIVSLLVNFVLLAYLFTLSILDGITIILSNKKSDKMLYLLNYLPLLFYGFFSLKIKIFLDAMRRKGSLLSRPKYKRYGSSTNRALNSSALDSTIMKN